MLYIFQQLKNDNNRTRNPNVGFTRIYLTHCHRFNVEKVIRSTPGTPSGPKRSQNGSKKVIQRAPNGDQNPQKIDKKSNQKRTYFQSRSRRAFWSVLGAEMEAESVKNQPEKAPRAKTAISGNHCFYNVKALIFEVRRCQKHSEIGIILKK